MNRIINLDRFAILLSGVCLVHCLLAPVILTLLPIFSLSALTEDLIFHRLMLWIVVPTSAVSLFLGCRKHRNWPIAITGIVGLMILCSVTFLGHDYLHINQEKIGTTIGGLILALSHYLNYRACQKIVCSSSNCSSQHHH